MISDKEWEFFSTPIRTEIMNLPSYECPKHGVVKNSGFVTIFVDQKPSSHHCMICYQDWLKANVPEVKLL